MFKSQSHIQKSPSYFPHQKRGDREKTPDYYIECIESGISVLWWNQNNFNSVRNTRREKVINYNLVNDILDRTEMELVTNPLRFDDATFPATYKNYPVLNKNLEVLFGEERKRIFSPMANVISEDIINEKQEFVNQEFIKMAVARLMADNIDEKQTEQEVGNFNKWKLGYRDRRERLVQQILDWGFKTKFFKETFSKGFEDLLIAGEEIYVADIFGGEPVLERYDPRNVYTLRSGDSPWIEDSDIIIIDQYMPIGKTIDRYHEYLTSTEISSIEEHWASGKGGMMQSLYNFPTNFGENSPYLSGMVDGDINDILASNRNMSAAFGGYYDPEGNVRVTRVLWKGMRKIGILTYFDEDNNELKKFVPEQYKPNKERGEQVKWEWVSEWYEGTKIGYDIYVKMQVLPFQSRHRDNPSICSPGITGAAINFGNNRSKSMVTLAKEWQYSYNAYMYRLNHLFIKSIGKVGVLPLHLLPSDWPMEKIMYYATVLGWIPFDAFNEAREGVATGKLGGHMSGVPTQIDLSYAEDIRECMMMLDFIKRELDDLMGITPQRRGAIDNRETVGGVERSVTQSTLSTERWYDWHDTIRRKALLAFLEVTKTAWKGKSFTKQYVLDDGTLAVLDFDSELFAETEFNISITSSSNDMQMFQALRSNIDRLLQSETPLSIIMDLQRTTSPAQLQRKIEAWEEQKQQMAEQARQEDLQLQQQEIVAKQQAEEAKLQLEYEKLDREDMNAQLDREVDLQKATISAMGFAKEGDADSNGIPDVIELEKLALEKSQKSFENALKLRQQKQSEKIDEETLKLKKKESAAKVIQMKRKPVAKK